jgi:hypothetical protein
VSRSWHVRDTVDTPLAIGTDWIGIPKLRTHVVSFYDWSGRDLGARRLDRLIHANGSLARIGGRGHHLAAPMGSVVQTFRVEVDAACAAAPSPTSGREAARREGVAGRQRGAGDAP